MRQTKRRMELLSFYDHTGIERHLTRMARKGWKVEKINNYFWTYRRIEPQELQVAVTYFPKASDFDPFPSGEQQTLIDYCLVFVGAGADWQRVICLFANQRYPAYASQS